MTNIEQIEKLKSLEVYSGLVKGGMISVSINFKYEIYNHFKTRLTVNQEFKDKKMKSYLETSEYFNVCELTVKRAIKYMEDEI